MKRWVQLVTSSAAVAAACIASSPSALAADTTPTFSTSQYSAETEFVPNGEMIGSGVVLLGTTYAASVVAATMSSNEADARLFVPVAGPWMAFAGRADGKPDSREETVGKALLVADGILQGIGALQIVGGLSFPKARTVITERAGVRIVPTIGRVNGLAAVGKF